MGILAASMAGAIWAQSDFQKGYSYYKQGQHDKAIPELEGVIQANPDYEDGYRILGDCYLKTKQYDKAATVFQQAIRLKGDLFPSYYGLALSYYNSSKYQESIDTLLKGERYAPFTSGTLRFVPHPRFGVFQQKGVQAGFVRLGESQYPSKREFD